MLLKTKVTYLGWYYFLSDSLVTTEMMDAFLSGPRTKEAKNSLKLLERGQLQVLSKGEHLTLSAVLVGHMLLCSGQRAGAIRNITMAEYKGRQPEDEFEVVSVRHHKTYYSGSAATVPLDKNLLSLIRTFVEFIREPLCMLMLKRQLKDDDILFVSPIPRETLFPKRIFESYSQTSGNKFNGHDYTQNDCNKDQRNPS